MWTIKIPRSRRPGRGTGISVQFTTVHYYGGIEDDPEYVAFADFNSDGWMDHMVQESSEYVTGVYLNRGNKVFNLALQYTVKENNFYYDDRSPAIGDFNEDGNLDIALASGSDSYTGIVIIWGNGNGYFAGETKLTSFGNAEIRKIVTADFDEDGHLDLAASDATNRQVIVSLNGDGSGTFGAGSTSTYPLTGCDGLSDIEFGDLDGDDDFDLVVIFDESGTDDFILQAFLNDGQADFSANSTTTVPVNHVDTGLALGDYNEDGDLDVVVESDQFRTIVLLCGVGDGTFDNFTYYVVGNNGYETAYIYNVSDINGDGHLDFIAAADDDEELLICLGNGNGTFISATVNFGYDFDIAGASVADFNGDGIFDIAVNIDDTDIYSGLYVSYGQSNDLIVL